MKKLSGWSGRALLGFLLGASLTPLAALPRIVGSTSSLLVHVMRVRSPL